MLDKPVTFLRHVGLAEGTSFLLLLGVAMPLKYFAGFPLAVKIVGWIHGVLFVAFLFALQRAASERGWPLTRIGIVFLAALVPFGPFVLDRRLKDDAASAGE